MAFTFSRGSRTWRVNGQLSGVIHEEADEIDAIRTWAAALGAEVHLSARHEAPTSGIAYRRLEAIKPLDYGASLHVWTHIAEAPISATTAPVMAAA